MGYLLDSYKPDLLTPLRTDLYELNMADAFNGIGRMDEESTFYLHWRKPAGGGGYTVSMGLEAIIDYFNNFRFQDSDIEFLRSLRDGLGKPRFKEDTLQKLKNTKLEVDLDAMAEGTPVTGAYPDLRIRGPKYQCMIAEAMLLQMSNRDSMVGTQTARCMEAGEGRSVSDNSLRRSASLDLGTARSIYVNGAGWVCDAGAAKLLGLGHKLAGTMAHLWVQSFVRPGISNKEAEFNAFVEWLKQKPGDAVLLVDTFDIAQGIDNAIAAARKTGVALTAMRIDTGDAPELLKWAHYADEKLSRAAEADPELFGKTGIVLTNDLDAMKIDKMVRMSPEQYKKQFPDRVRFGVGTFLGNPGPLGGVFKISSYKPKLHKPKVQDGVATQVRETEEAVVIQTMKVAGLDLSDPAHPRPGSKSSLPGEELDAVRLRDSGGKIIADVIVDTARWNKSISPKENLDQTGFFLNIAGGRAEVKLPAFASAELLLKPVYRKGKYVYKEPPKKEAYPGGPQVTDLDWLQAHAKKERQSLPAEVRRIELPERLPLFMDPRIAQEQQKIIAKMAEMPAQVKTAQIDVDIDRQNGFSRPGLSQDQGGSLYVPEAELVAPRAGDMLARTRDGIILLSQDYHPENHISFMTNHPGVMEYRQGKVSAPEDAMNPLKLPFNEMVLDADGQVIGIKEMGDKGVARVRKVALQSAKTGAMEGPDFTPSEQDRGRIAKVRDDYFDMPFDEMKEKQGITTQMLWTPHCIQNTTSCQYVDELGLPEGLKQLLEHDKKSHTLKFHDDKTGNTFHVIRKGMNSELDSYGIGIENDKFTRTSLPQVMRQIVIDLKKNGYKRAVINFKGLATNFCVEYSHNNIRSLLNEEFFKTSGIEFEFNFLRDQSRGIPIPGGRDVPFSVEGAAERMAEYDPVNPTHVTSGETILRSRQPRPEAHGELAVAGGQPRKAARA